MNIQLCSDDDIFLWPCGTRCYRSEYEQGNYQQMSDDFEIIPFGSERYKVVEEQE